MTGTDIAEPRFDIAQRMLRRIDLRHVTDEHVAGVLRDAGFHYAQAGSGIPMHAQLAFLVGAIGEFETRFLLQAAGGIDLDYQDQEDPAAIEFQVRLTNSLQEQVTYTGHDEAQLLPGPIRDIAYGHILDLCAVLDVQLHPWVTPEGDLLLQWRRDGMDHVVMLYLADDWAGVRMGLETVQRREDLVYSAPVLSAFIRYGSWVTSAHH